MVVIDSQCRAGASRRSREDQLPLHSNPEMRENCGAREDSREGFRQRPAILATVDVDETSEFSMAGTLVQ